jgi:hypothetical protein
MYQVADGQILTGAMTTRRPAAHRKPGVLPASPDSFCRSPDSMLSESNEQLMMSAPLLLSHRPDRVTP